MSSTSNSKTELEAFPSKLKRMAGPCLILPIFIKTCQLLNSINQVSYKALFCKDGGALKFTVSILNLYFFCSHVKMKIHLSAHLCVTDIFYIYIFYILYPCAKLDCLSFNVAAQLIWPNDKQSATKGLYPSIFADLHFS